MCVCLYALRGHHTFSSQRRRTKQNAFSYTIELECRASSVSARRIMLECGRLQPFITPEGIAITAAHRDHGPRDQRRADMISQHPPSHPRFDDKYTPTPSSDLHCTAVPSDLVTEWVVPTRCSPQSPGLSLARLGLASQQKTVQMWVVFFVNKN